MQPKVEIQGSNIVISEGNRTLVVPYTAHSKPGEVREGQGCAALISVIMLLLQGASSWLLALVALYRVVHTGLDTLAHSFSPPTHPPLLPYLHCIKYKDADMVLECTGINFDHIINWLYPSITADQVQGRGHGAGVHRRIPHARHAAALL